MTTATAPVSTCAATACAFNDSQSCTAVAITVGGVAGTASCTTFAELDVRAGLNDGHGQVGACHRVDCVHNSNLLCSASGIEVADSAACTTYEAR